jgi:ubiquinone/menaquinone biosynthesis C-methylase UbiE/chromosome segregation ATPase
VKKKNNDTKRQIPSPGFTGERFIPHQTDPILALEHYHRYLLASQFVRGKRVLDIACGEGYGSAFLSISASSVLGVDRDQPTIDAARGKYSSYKNVSFLAGSCEDVAFPDGDFDVVVCFETLEHLGAQSQKVFLEKMKRVLVKNGMLIVSTPESEAYAEIREGRNEFHEHEFMLPEFRELLSSCFRKIRLIGQRPVTVSAMWDLDAGIEYPFEFQVRKDFFGSLKRGDQLSKPLYLVAVCSDRPVSKRLMARSNSVYFDLKQIERSREIYLWAKKLQSERDERSRWALKLDADLKNQRAHAVKVQQQFEDRSRWAVKLSEELQERKAYIASLQKEHEDRTVWAKKLSAELEIACGRIAILQSEHAERTAWAKKLSEELDATRLRINVLRQEYDERTTWAMGLSADLEAARNHVAALQKEHDERALWVKKLSEELEAARSRVTMLQQQYDERTTWAVGLSADLETARSRVALLQKESNDRVEWAKKLSTELEIARTRVALLQKESDERTAWAKKLSTELDTARSRVALLQKESDERTAWTKKLSAELGTARSRIASLQKEYDERTVWAQKINSELNERKVYIADLQKQYEERTRWALKLNADLDDARSQLNASNQRSNELQQQVIDTRRQLHESQLLGSILEEKLGHILNSPVYKIFRLLGILPRYRL